MRQPLLNDVFQSAFANLDAWVRKGIAPSKAARIDVTNGGTPQALIVRDQHGNATGGVRTPFVDLPATTYLTGLGDKPGCGANFGSEAPFDWARLGSHLWKLQELCERDDGSGRSRRQGLVADRVRRQENQGGPCAPQSFPEQQLTIEEVIRLTANHQPPTTNR